MAVHGSLNQCNEEKEEVSRHILVILRGSNRQDLNIDQNGDTEMEVSRGITRFLALTTGGMVVLSVKLGMWEKVWF